MNKTIIASAPKQTETMGILHEAGGVFQVEPEDDEKLADVICDLLVKKNEQGLAFERDSRYVEQFSRRAQTEILAGILDKICSEKASGGAGA